MISNKEQAIKKLIRVYEDQITQLTEMSKIELGDDVIEEIHKLKDELLGPESPTKKQTAVELLFLEFKTLAENMRKGGDASSAALIDFLCEREDVAKAKEKDQIVDAWNSAYGGDSHHDGESFYSEEYGN